VAATDRKRRRVPCCLFWAAGLAGLPLSHWLLFARIDPFYSVIYPFLWWPFIFSVDLLVYLLRRNSLLHDRPWEFLLLTLWSTPVWLIFEALNLRLHNWHYVQVPLHPDAGNVFLIFAFATVLPGVFEVAELVIGLIEKGARTGRIAGRPFHVTQANLAIQMILGALMLILALAWPERFFCLVWGFAFLILDPVCYVRKGRSLLGQLAAGDNTRLVALLISGAVCGGLWEAWNISARSKWIYTVPFFDELKIGEMPVLGFLGFPPFVLECYAIVNLIGLFRGGRSWELGAAENAERKGMAPRLALWAWCAVVSFSLLTALGIFRVTVSSYSIPLDAWFAGSLGEKGAAALRREKAIYSHQFLRLKTRPEEIDPALYEKMRSLCALAEVAGMGLAHAEILLAAGIETPEELARGDPELIAMQVRRLSQLALRPRTAQVRVWIREAKEQLRTRQGP